MSHHHPQRVLTPSASRKRKEMESLFKESAAQAQAQPKAVDSVLSSGLLAGYMAHEFLTQGTLLGQKWDPDRAGAEAVSNGWAEWKRTKPVESQPEPSRKMKNHRSYAEVASLLGGDGGHVPGIVNPTELAHWLEM